MTKFFSQKFALAPYKIKGDFNCTGCTSLDFKEFLTMPSYSGILICDRETKEKIKNNTEVTSGNSIERKVKGIHDGRIKIKDEEIKDFNEAFEEWLRENSFGGKLEIRYNKNEVGVFVKGNIIFNKNTKFVAGLLPGKILSPFEGNITLEECENIDFKLKGFPEEVNGDVTFKNINSLSKIEFAPDVLRTINGNFIIHGCDKLLGITSECPRFVSKNFEIRECHSLDIGRSTANTIVGETFVYYNNAKVLDITKNIKIHCKDVDMSDDVNNGGYPPKKIDELRTKFTGDDGTFGSTITNQNNTNTQAQTVNQSQTPSQQTTYYVKFKEFDNSGDTVFEIANDQSEAEFIVKAKNKNYYLFIKWDANKQYDLSACEIYKNPEYVKILESCFNCNSSASICLNNPPIDRQKYKPADVEFSDNNGEITFTHQIGIGNGNLEPQEKNRKNWVQYNTNKDYFFVNDRFADAKDPNNALFIAQKTNEDRIYELKLQDQYYESHKSDPEYYKIIKVLFDIPDDDMTNKNIKVDEPAIVFRKDVKLKNSNDITSKFIIDDMGQYDLKKLSKKGKIIFEDKINAA